MSPGWATGASPTAVSSYSDFISRTGDKSSAVTFEAVRAKTKYRHYIFIVVPLVPFQGILKSRNRLFRMILSVGAVHSSWCYFQGETLQFCEVPVIDDTLYEDSEKFHVKLQSFDEIDVSPTTNTTQVIIAADPSDGECEFSQSFLGYDVRVMLENK